MTHQSAFSDYVARLREFIRFSMAPRDVAPQNGSVEDGFNGLARELFTLQFRHNENYRLFCQVQKIVPQKIDRWTEIPAMPAAGFKEFDLTSLQEEERTRVFYSSGTTGQTPSRHFHDTESLSVYEGSLLSWFQASFLGEMVCVSEPVRDYAFPAKEHSAGQPSSPRLRGGTTSARQARPSPPAEGGEGEKYLNVDTQGGTRSARLPWAKFWLPLWGAGVEKKPAAWFVMLTPPAAQAPHSSLVHMFETIAREFAPSDSSFTGCTEG